VACRAADSANKLASIGKEKKKGGRGASFPAYWGKERGKRRVERKKKRSCSSRKPCSSISSEENREKRKGKDIARKNFHLLAEKGKKKGRKSGGYIGCLVIYRVGLGRKKRRKR